MKQGYCSKVLRSTLFSAVLAGVPGVGVAGYGNTIATYDVSYQNLNPANGSYVLWTLAFGNDPYPNPATFGSGFGVDVELRLPFFPCASFFPTDCVSNLPGFYVPDTGTLELPTADSVFFTPGANTDDLANWASSSPFGGTILSFSALSLAFQGVSFPGDFAETFTFTDPVGGSAPVPFEFIALSVDQNGASTRLAEFSLLFYPDGTSQVLGSTGVDIVRTSGAGPTPPGGPPTPAPEPSTVLLLAAGACALLWRSAATRQQSSPLYLAARPVNGTSSGSTPNFVTREPRPNPRLS